MARTLERGGRKGKKGKGGSASLRFLILFFVFSI